MKKIIAFICAFIPLVTNAQITDFIDSDMTNTYLQAYSQMTQRVLQISKTIQPYREQMYHFYQNGQYKDAILLCHNIQNKYIYYVFDHRAISDIECLAGDCAEKIGNEELAILFYKDAQKAEDSMANEKLNQLFFKKLNDARYNYSVKAYDEMKKNINVAMSTGLENGECYFFYGVYNEYIHCFSEAKKMYKIAKKKGYSYAKKALYDLKLKMK